MAFVEWNIMATSYDTKAADDFEIDLNLMVDGSGVTPLSSEAGPI